MHPIRKRQGTIATSKSGFLKHRPGHQEAVLYRLLLFTFTNKSQH